MNQEGIVDGIVRKIIQKIGQDYTGCLFILIGATLWTLGFIYCNQNNMHFVQTILMLGTSIFFINLAISRIYHYPIDFKDPYLYKMLFKRNIGMVFHIYMIAVSQFYLPLPIVHTLSNTGPLFAILIDYLLFNVTINVKQIVGVIIGTIGIVFTVNGEILMLKLDSNYVSNTDFTNYSTNSIFIKLLIGCLLVLAMIFWGYGVTLTKKMKVNSCQMNLFISILLIISSAILYPIVVQKPVPVSVYLFSYLKAGIILTIAELFYIAAFTIAKNAGMVSIVGFVAILIGYLISIFRYNQNVNPICSLGGILILVGVCRVVLNKQSNQPLNNINNSQSKEQLNKVI